MVHAAPHSYWSVFRTTSTGSTLGISSPSSSRLTDSHLNELSSSLVMTFVADARPPSGRVAVFSMTQRSPLRFQLPSAKPPSESKTHERICLLAASQPMICIPDRFTWSPIAKANERVMKFLFLVH